jgi:hypothetical protein
MPSVTVIETQTPEKGLSNGQGVVLAPMPVKKGGRVCLYADRTISACRWDVFNLMGVSLKHFAATSLAESCMTTDDLAPGIYMVRLNLMYPGGDESTVWKKVLVQP